MNTLANQINLQKFFMRKIVPIVCIALFAFSCNWFSSKDNVGEKEQEGMEYQLKQENTEKMKQIFFVLPSPIEISLLIKKSGIHFQEDLLNSTENLPGYSTSPSRAIALGVYCADLSYASLNEQYQTSAEYINVARNLAESLGVLRTVDQEKMKMLENNITNKDLIIDIVSEIYMEASEQLREQDRYSLASLMLIGGWIESLYLATQSIEPNEPTHKVLVERVLDQKLSLESIKVVLHDNQSDPTIAPIYKDVLELERLFNKSLKSKEESNDDFYELMNLGGFEQLVIKVDEMRDYLVH